jgi:copper resistance protein C
MERLGRMQAAFPFQLNLNAVMEQFCGGKLPHGALRPCPAGRASIQTAEVDYAIWRLVNFLKGKPMILLRWLSYSALFAGLACLNAHALAHPTLLASSPSSGAMLDAPPKEIVLTFSEKLEPAFSSVKVADSSGRDIASSKGRADPAASSRLQLTLPVLKAGTYTVRWNAVGHDAHPLKGDYIFTVK